MAGTRGILEACLGFEAEIVKMRMVMEEKE